jgi:hypothetical protein
MLGTWTMQQFNLPLLATMEGAATKTTAAAQRHLQTSTVHNIVMHPSSSVIEDSCFSPKKGSFSSPMVI